MLVTQFTRVPGNSLLAASLSIYRMMLFSVAKNEARTPSQRRVSEMQSAFIIILDPTSTSGSSLVPQLFSLLTPQMRD